MDPTKYRITVERMAVPAPGSSPPMRQRFIAKALEDGKAKFVGEGATRDAALEDLRARMALFSRHSN